MIKAAISGVLGFLLLVLESFIVMKIKGMQTIEFGGVTPFINVWALNFFFAFSILTQITQWVINRTVNEKGEEEY